MVACAGNDAADVIATATTFVAFMDDDLGLSLDDADGWITKSDAIGLNLASGAEAVESDTKADIGDEAFVTVIRHLASTTLDTPVDGETLRIILAIVTESRAKGNPASFLGFLDHFFPTAILY